MHDRLRQIKVHMEHGYWLNDPVERVMIQSDVIYLLRRIERLARQIERGRKGERKGTR